MFNRVKSFLGQEKGMGTVEIVIIIAILVGLALIFRNQLINLVNLLFDRVFSDVGSASQNSNVDTTVRSLTK